MLAGKGLSVRSGHFQSNDPGWQTCLQQTRYQIKQRRKRISRFLVVITRYGVKIMVQGKGQHTACQTSELRPHLFRWTGRKMFVFRQHPGEGIQRIQQPEKGYIGDGKIGESFVIFTTHCHQSLASGAKLAIEQHQTFAKDRTCPKRCYWRNKRRILSPRILSIPDKPCYRAHFPGIITFMSKPDGEIKPGNSHGCFFRAKGILQRYPLFSFGYKKAE